jgi:hypothetical protein
MLQWCYKDVTRGAGVRWKHRQKRDTNKEVVMVLCDAMRGAYECCEDISHQHRTTVTHCTVGMGGLEGLVESVQVGGEMAEVGEW